MSSILIMPSEDGTLDFEVTVKNALTGLTVTSTVMTWTLTDRDGTVINSRTDVSVTPANPTYITLTGDDLQIIDQTTEREFRILTVVNDEGTSARPQTQVAKFWVKNLKAIT